MNTTPRITKISLAPEDDKKSIPANKPVTKEEIQELLERIKKSEDVEKKTKKEEMTPEEMKKFTDGLAKKVVKPFMKYVSLPLSTLPMIGGGIVLATATATLPLIAGAGAIAAGLWTAGNIIKAINSDDIQNKVKKEIDRLGNKLDPNATPPVKDAKYFLKAGLGLGFSVAKLGTSVALFSLFAATSGFFACAGLVTLGLCLGIGGGIGTLTRTGLMIKDVKQKIESSFLKDLPKEEPAPATAAPDLSASPVASIKAGADFNASATPTTANDNKVEAKPDLKINAPRFYSHLN